jgi:site-specific recombinase XerC
VPAPTTPDPLAAIKSLVLDAVTSPHTRRSYDLALSRFLEWYVETGSPGLTKATVQRYRSALEQGLSASSLNVHLSALRKLPVEPELGRSVTERKPASGRSVT